jgi:hypothetical protein
MTHEPALNPIVIHPSTDVAITRRDLFAAHAINGLLSAMVQDNRSSNIEHLVVEAARIADQLITELEIV